MFKCFAKIFFKRADYFIMTLCKLSHQIMKKYRYLIRSDYFNKKYSDKQ